VNNMGLNGNLYCDVCREKIMSLENQEYIDREFEKCMIPLFNGSIDIKELKIFLKEHEFCSEEKNHIVFDIN